MAEVNYVPSDLAKLFIQSRAPVNAIMGPLGSGKTVANIMKTMFHAKLTLKSATNRKRMSRHTIIRNTQAQLSDTTIKSFLQWFPDGTLGTYQPSTKTYFINYGDIQAEVLFRALDREEDARRVLSLDTTTVYLNEWREILSSLFLALRGRCGRYPPKEPITDVLLSINELTFDMMAKRHNDEVEYLDESLEFMIPSELTIDNYRDHMDDNGAVVYPNKTLVDGRQNPMYGKPIKVSLHDWFGIMADTNPPDDLSFIYNTFEKDDDSTKILHKSSKRTGLDVEKYGEVIRVEWLKEEDTTPSHFVDMPVDDQTNETIIDQIKRHINELQDQYKQNIQMVATDNVPAMTAQQEQVLADVPMMNPNVPGIFQRRAVQPQQHQFQQTLQLHGSGAQVRQDTMVMAPTKTTALNEEAKQVAHYNRAPDTAHEAQVEDVRQQLADLMRTVERQRRELMERQLNVIGKKTALATDGQRTLRAQWMFIKQPSGVSPFADNLENLPPGYYRNLTSGATDSWIKVNVKAQYGATVQGTPIYKDSFKVDFHCTTGLKYNPMIPLLLGMDFGRTPCAIVKQRQNTGHILTLREFVLPEGQTMGLSLFLQSILKPGLATHFPNMPVVIAGDPSGEFGQQGDEKSLFDILHENKFQTLTPSTNKIDPRIRAVENWLKLNIAGKPLYVIDKEHCPILTKGFEVGYVYRKRRTGDTADKPNKNYFSHIHDANQYADMMVNDQANASTEYVQQTIQSVNEHVYVWT